MNVEDELSDLHNQLQELYVGRSTDVLQIKRLWLQIDKLEVIKDQVVEYED